MPAKRVRGVLKMRAPQRWPPANRCAPQRTRGASPGPGSAATAAGGRASYAAPDCKAGAGRGAKRARYHMGAFLAPSSYWRRAKPARGPAGPTGQGRGAVPSGWPPDAAGTDKMQGRPRPKGIKAGPCILPLHFGRGCGMALPPPGQPTGQGTTGSAGPQKGIKGPVLPGGPQPPALQCRG